MRKMQIIHNSIALACLTGILRCSTAVDPMTDNGSVPAQHLFNARIEKVHDLVSSQISREPLVASEAIVDLLEDEDSDESDSVVSFNGETEAIELSVKIVDLDDQNDSTSSSWTFTDPVEPMNQDLNDMSDVPYEEEEDLEFLEMVDGVYVSEDGNTLIFERETPAEEEVYEVEDREYCCCYFIDDHWIWLTASELYELVQERPEYSYLLPDDEEINDEVIDDEEIDVG